MSLINSKFKIIVSILLIIIILVGLFYKQRKEQKVLGESDDEHLDIRGLVIPHHDLAFDLIIRAIESSKKDTGYRKIVIIGPNHYYPNSPFITTGDSLRDYSIDEDYVTKLVSYDHVHFDNEMLGNEHSIGIPIEYLGKAYPEADFIPIIVSHYYNEESMDKFAEKLSEDFSSETLFVMAVDFSHNVGFEEAMRNNDDSISAIERFDYNTIINFDDRYMDSPLSTILFLNIMEKLGAKNWQTYDSSHASLLKGIPNLQGTSYVTGVFSK
ncbi:AmmeMemoRadiSam system protein B [Candidatus Woesebacteria bacterium]|nr:AmmeMemoRadiSam system protein B [Candidatus Woesebacteria bacterium]